jgi:hypothetical protein
MVIFYLLLHQLQYTMKLVLLMTTSLNSHPQETIAPASLRYGSWKIWRAFTPALSSCCLELPQLILSVQPLPQKVYQTSKHRYCQL